MVPFGSSCIVSGSRIVLMFLGLETAVGSDWLLRKQWKRSTGLVLGGAKKMMGHIGFGFGLVFFPWISEQPNRAFLSILFV